MMFGISYPCQGESPASLTDAFELATHLAFDHVALPGAFIDRIEKTRSMEFVPAFRRAARGHNLTHSFHLVSRDPVLLDDERLDVDGVQRVFFALNLARLVGAAFVVMQPMPLGEYQDADAIARVYRALAQHAHEQGVPLAVANPWGAPRRYPHTLDQFRALGDAVDDLYLLLDTAHAYREGENAGIEGYVTAFGARVLGVHVRDVDADAHLPVGGDRPDLQRLAHQLRHRRIDVPWILDYRTREALLRGRTRLEHLA